MAEEDFDTNPYDDEPQTQNSNSEEGTDITTKTNQIHREYEHGLDVESGILYLIGTITEDTVYEIIGGIRLIRKYRNLINQKQNDSIDLFIHSYGGDLYAALAIVDYINSLKIKINTVTRGVAYSAAGLVLISGTGQRCMGKNSFLMFHEVGSDMVENMKNSNLKSNTEHINILQDMVESILESKSNKHKDFWEQKTKTDLFVSSSQAKEFGLIDKII
jgi:ATP-dependent Clp protease protease subunit